MSEDIVAKFGGTSLADAGQIKKVRDIIRSDGNRRWIVVSAPGKRESSDRKITDLLYLCHSLVQQRLTFDDVFSKIEDRFQNIAEDLETDLALDTLLARVKEEIASAATAEHTASRGEYLNAQIIARVLDFEFVDAADIIRFTPEGTYDPSATSKRIKERLSGLEHAVIPGFYGSQADGTIRTFARGGSDLTGAIVAAALQVKRYENWTDVSGLLMADPTIVTNPQTIRSMTYFELRELTYMGVPTIQEKAVFPVARAGIPLQIRNTNDPDDPGTLIVRNSEPLPADRIGVPTGIAGRKDFTVIRIHKALMNEELGFGWKVLNVLKNNDISFEHMPSGIDTLSVVIQERQLEGKLFKVLSALKQECKLDEHDDIDVEARISLIATVGRGMARKPGTAANLFLALADANVNVHMIDQGSSEMNIILGVASDDFEKAIRAIYEKFTARQALCRSGMHPHAKGMTPE
jgi:aspartate kinase